MDDIEPAVNQLQSKLRSLKDLQENSEGKIAQKEIIDVVTSIIASLEGGFTLVDLKLYAELEGLVKFIQTAKSELAKLRPTEISERHINEATDELDAVVGATEEATSQILDACEGIEKIAGEMVDEKGQKLTEAVTRIYESCNFQDITGQRITKVVKTLRYIEGRINALLVTLDQDLRSPDRFDKLQKSSGQVNEKDLLNGPQLPKDANTQASIDALFNNL